MPVELTPGHQYIQDEAGQRYAAFVRGMHTCIVSFSDDSQKIETDDVAKILHDNVALIEANSIGSAIHSSFRTRHKPVLDLDMDVMVIPSSTPGHHHLYIDHEMSWQDYSLLLWVLQHVGILQPGYVNASLARRETFLRTPWTRKGDDSAAQARERSSCATCDGGGCHECREPF